MAKHVLIVDDSKIVRKVSRQMMEQLGFDISEAEDGQTDQHLYQGEPVFCALGTHRSTVRMMRPCGSGLKRYSASVPCKIIVMFGTAP